MEDAQGGKYLARPLTGDARAILERRLREIDRLLLPMDPGDRFKAASFISAMLSGFLNARSNDPKATLAHFTAVLQEFPLWAIKEACSQVSNGKLPDLSADFAPSAPRMFQAVADCLLQLRGERFKIAQILEAPSKDEVAPDEQQRERIRIGFKKLSDELAPKTLGDKAQQISQKADAARRAIAANDRDILEEWQQAGKEPVFANGRAISLSLARQIEAGFSPSTAADF